MSEKLREIFFKHFEKIRAIRESREISQEEFASY